MILEAKPDVLVNNAGGIPAGRSEVEILDLNLRSALVVTQLAVERGARTIVNIASVAGIAAGPMVAMETITAAVSDLLADETARGRVVVLR